MDKITEIRIEEILDEENNQKYYWIYYYKNEETVIFEYYLPEHEKDRCVCI